MVGIFAAIWRPVGELELPLVDRIVSTAWLRRAVAVESALFNKEASPHHTFNTYRREKMGLVSRNEVTLGRSLYKALHELQCLQRHEQAVSAGADGHKLPELEFMQGHRTIKFYHD